MACVSVSMPAFRHNETTTTTTTTTTTEMDPWSALEMLATVAVQVYEKEKKPTVDMSMSEKKPLPFDLNVKLRTHGRPRTTPININALLPCLNRKRKLEDIADDSGETGVSQDDNKKRLIVRFRLQSPAQQLEPQLPSEYKQRIDELGGSDVRFVIKKKLYPSDLDSGKSRLTMPFRQCGVDFGEVGKTQVKVIYSIGSESLSEMMMTFSKWETVSSYVFTGSWNDLVQKSHLKDKDLIQVWTFKERDQLCFALVKL